jgi:hypothetical protein
LRKEHVRSKTKEVAFLLYTLSNHIQRPDRLTLPHTLYLKEVKAVDENTISAEPRLHLQSEDFQYGSEVRITDCNLHFPRAKSVVRIVAVEIPVNDLLQIGPPVAVMQGKMPSFKHPVSSPKARVAKGGRPSCWYPSPEP